MDYANTASVAAFHYRDSRIIKTEEVLAEEVHIFFEYNGVFYKARQATPSDLLDLALGFSLTEGIIDKAAELLGCEIKPQQNGICLSMTISKARFEKLKARTNEAAFETMTLSKSSEKPVHFTFEALQAGFSQMEKQQALREQTGATHAAAWMDQKNQVTFIREDVGRHNALDKLIGALSAKGIDFAFGAILVTSRASYEMVQKCVMIGASVLAAVSAPTALAVRLANDAGLTLAGFVRKGTQTIYTGEKRFSAKNAVPD